MAPVVNPGFVKASSDNLPDLDIFMLTQFLKSDDRFNAAEIRGVKASQASRETYGDSAIGYVELKRENSRCIIRGKICPEHKIRNKNYTVELVVNEEEEKVEDVKCYDCAASEGGCKHALAFLGWCHRKSAEPSVTEVECYWSKPRLSNIATTKKFIDVKDFRARASSSRMPTNLPSSELFLNKIVNIGIQKNINSHITTYKSKISEEDPLFFSLHNLLYEFKKTGKEEAHEFIEFMQSVFTENVCITLEEKTRNQHDSPLWHEIRYGRITASKLYEVSRCKTSAGSLVETIIGVKKVQNTKAMERGRKLEREVLKEVQTKLGLKIKPCGLIPYLKNPLFSASPDGICDDPDLIVEVKCPVSEKNFQMYIKDGIINKKYQAQMLLQMLVCGKKRGIFCVAKPNFEVSKEFEYMYLDYNEEIIISLMDCAEIFWRQHIFPKIASM